MVHANDRATLVFYVNGKKVVEKNVDPEWTLLYYLRNKLRLCGTKLGCGEGGCGACTVMVSKYDRLQDKLCHFAVNACLAPICSVHGLSVTTVEGIGSTKTRLHPVQERIAKAHGSQCGFCTPGIVMSMYALLRSSPKPTMKDVEIAFQGNLCRCTGYRPIIEGYRSFTENPPSKPVALSSTNACAMGNNCCKFRNEIMEKEDDVLFKRGDFTPYDASQEPIFPPELKLSDAFDKHYLVFKGKNVTWYRPTQLNEVLDLKSKHNDAKIVVGNTEVGVEVKFKHCVYPVIIQPTHIKEMTSISLTPHGMRVGASVTIQEMENALKLQIKTQQEHKTRIFEAIVNMLHYFAGRQIRNVAAVGGNIMTGSPISDLNPIFMAARVELELQSKERGLRKVIFDDHFFTGYRKNIVKPDEILLAINVPYSKKNQHFYAYKQAKRRDDDIAIINMAFNVTFRPQSSVIDNLELAFGGMAPTVINAPKTSAKLKGLPWNREMVETAFTHLIEDLPLPPNVPGGMVQYRRSLTLSLFFRAFIEISQRIQEDFPQITIDPREKSAACGFRSKIPRSSQFFHIANESSEKTDTVGRPVVHASAFKQATGEAVYCDDMPVFQNELYMGFVLSEKAHAKILSIDPADALQTEGVDSFFSADDIPKDRNRFGPVHHDEEIFVSKTVTSQGQILGIVLANDQATAQRAARKVKVKYEELKPVIVSIEDSIQHQSYFPKSPKKIVNGDVDKALKEAPHVIEGECRMGGQEHFYLETQSVIAVPKKEDNEMEIYCSTQHPSEITHLASKVLGVQQNKIVTKVKRMGGGFGGKESKAAMVALPAIIAASKLDRPVRCMLDRDEDIIMTGGRHPCYTKYKVAFDKNGKILGCELHLYLNCGYSSDLSNGVLDRAMLHFENAYKIPNCRIFGYACKTNLPSNTAFRGFGGPQGMFAAENIVQHIADYLKKDPVDISRINLYKEGDITHYSQKLEYCTIERCWQEAICSSNYETRKKEIEMFNKQHYWKKRGISVIPTKFGIAFTIPFLNQGGALIHVYTDGSVLLSHGGTEMGQGLHTKMIQVASKALEISIDKIHISETSTDKVPNTSPTAASSGSDINGMAVLEACNKIKDRLKPYMKKNPTGAWEEWVYEAYYDRVSLSATGFHKTPGLGYNFETNTGNAFNYYTYGAAVSEVEIDCLTGDHQVLRTDIVMDLGESLNPAIDIGQIEGAFMQGYGLFVLEEMMYSSSGTTYTRGPGAYKLPGFADIPIEFNVSLLKGAPNPRAVYSSKAVGEPPLFLATSVFFAIREAIKSAREDRDVKTPLVLTAPATAAKIRMACQDQLTSKLKEPKPGSFSPWNVTA